MLSQMFVGQENNTSHQTVSAVQLQAAGTDIGPDEDPGEAGPCRANPRTHFSSPISLASGWMMPSFSISSELSLTWNSMKAL